MRNSTKRLLSGVAIAGALTLGLAACSTPAADTTESPAAVEDLGTLKVGATATPAGEILQFLIDSGEAENAGLDLQITEFTDYTTPDPALSEGSIDANLFQHKPFLDLYNTNAGDTLISVGQVYLPPLALYSKTVKDIKDLKDGATIALPNDASNEGRALLLLAGAGLIETTDAPTTVVDITGNPNNYQFLEVDAASLPAALDDQDAAIVNFNFAAAAGLSGDLQILKEGTDSKYYNILATREEMKDDPRITALYTLLTSQAAKDFIEATYSGLVIPVE